MVVSFSYQPWPSTIDVLGVAGGKAAQAHFEGEQLVEAELSDDAAAEGAGEVELVEVVAFPIGQVGAEAEAGKRGRGFGAAVSSAKAGHQQPGRQQERDVSLRRTGATGDNLGKCNVWNRKNSLPDRVLPTAAANQGAARRWGSLSPGWPPSGFDVAVGFLLPFGLFFLLLGEFSLVLGE